MTCSFKMQWSTALLALGGLAGAGTVTWFGNVRVEETPMGDGKTRVRLFEGDKEVFDGVLKEDEALFQIEEGPAIQVKPAEDQR